MTACPIGYGTRTGYTKGCRCDRCTAANTAYSAELRDRGRGHGHGPHITRDYDPAWWMAHKACSPADADLFFPARGDNDAVDAAKAICARCEVRADCLAYAYANDEYVGVWGGLSGRERRQARARRRQGRAA